MVCRSIHKHFGGDDITERQEHLHQLSIPKLLREVVDEQVAALWSCTETDRCTDRGGKEMMGTKKKGLTSERKESDYTNVLQFFAICPFCFYRTAHGSERSSALFISDINI